MLAASLKRQLETTLATTIVSTESLSQNGGIELLALTCQDTSYMLKMSHFPDHDGLNTEVDGLQTLQKSGVKIPKMISWTDDWLVLEKIETEKPHKAFWKNLATTLAKLHQTSAPGFGYKHDNWIGATRQRQIDPAQEILSWGEFFWIYRLQAQWDLLKKNNNFPWTEDQKDQLRTTCIRELNAFKAKPTVLHGDLWSGNVLCGKDQEAYLIDPALYYGDREADIAMTECFGKFDPEFYTTYNELLPLGPGYQRRKPIYNLYHQLNHWNVFGEAYEPVCEKTRDIILAL